MMISAHPEPSVSIIEADREGECARGSVAVLEADFEEVLGICEFGPVTSACPVRCLKARDHPENPSKHLAAVRPTGYVHHDQLPGSQSL